MPAPSHLPSVRARVERVYGDSAEACLAEIDRATAGVVAELEALAGGSTQPRWSERDVVMITYADQLRSDEEQGSAGYRPPLGVLNGWLLREGLDEQLNTVHLLPFCPYSSDDGFSVIDYLAVDPASGTWSDIARLGEGFGLMFDLVLNHCSEKSDYFQRFVAGEPPYDRFFIEIDPGADLSQVTRPRPGPPWKEVETSRGTKRVWSTFSDGAVKDQMDLNYSEPAVLAEMMRVLLEYAARGARIVRLDAVAFLWKEVGATCMHLPETHEIVKLCRDVLEAYSPRTLVLTETNVPHAENVSYFGEVDPADGEGDEAHMVYNFSLPPLLLDAFTSGDATAIRAWLADLADPPPGCTFFNFTASHDGVGVRPIEGLVSDERFDRMIKAVATRGGKINTRRRPDGTDAPYELNITFVDAMSPDEPDEELHARRFLSSQAAMLALRGMPAVYFHSLVGTRNDDAGVQSSGQNRRINRHKYTQGELDAHLAIEGTLQRRIYDGYRRLLALRTRQPAFHPDAPQEVIDPGDDRVLAFRRTSLDGGQTIYVAVNFSAEPVSVSFSANEPGTNLLTAESLGSSQAEIEAGGFIYFECKA